MPLEHRITDIGGRSLHGLPVRQSTAPLQETYGYRFRCGRDRWVTKRQRLYLRPLGVCQSETVHAKLLSELESRTFQSVTPDSERALER